MLVLGYIWLPFVALPIFVSLESLDRRLLEAATDLGASRLQAFRRVTLPLSLPGVVAAFLFVFIPTVGEFVTPSLVGGTSGYMYGNQIVDLFGTGLPGLADRLGARDLPARRRRRADGRLLALPPGAAGGGGLMDVALSKNGARVLRGVLRPAWSSSSTRRSLILLHLLVQRLGAAVVPAQRVHAALVPRVPARRRAARRAGDERDRRGAVEPRRGRARHRSRRSRSRGAASGARPPSRRCCSARS